MRISSSARARRVALSTPRIFSGKAMLSPTVLCGNSASDWKTRQVGRRFGGRSLTRSPRSTMSPLVGRSMPASIRSTVVLPEPEGPTMVKNSPSPTSRSMDSTATKLSKVLRSPTSCRIGRPETALSA